MFKKHWKMIVITSLITRLPMLAGLILWNKLPDPIPTHDRPTRKGRPKRKKGDGLFGIPHLLATGYSEE